MADTTHTAAGQMLGYLFQPDRAMLLLCSCRSNESVCVEVVDDVSVVDDKGNVILREQDKSSIDVGSNTFQNKGKDLWNTLNIWTVAIQAKTLDLSKTKLLCVTNKTLPEKSIVKKISVAEKDEDIAKIIADLKKIGGKPSKEIEAFTKVVLKDEATLSSIIKAITVVDCQTMEKRNEDLSDKLMLAAYYKDEAIEDLRGWFYSRVISSLEKAEPTIISRTSLITAKDKIVQRHLDLRVKVQAKRSIQITDELKEETINSTFVKQLELVNHPSLDSYIADAIEDYLCSEIESTRLVEIGELTKPDFLDMEERNKERWKDIFRSHLAKLKTGLTDEEISSIAFEIYDTTIQNYTARLGSHSTELYFTKGNYHKLANELEVGWHPHWKTKFAKP